MAKMLVSGEILQWALPPK